MSNPSAADLAAVAAAAAQLEAAALNSAAADAPGQPPPPPRVHGRPTRLRRPPERLSLSAVGFKTGGRCSKASPECRLFLHL
jgi:hypothetical protein